MAEKLTKEQIVDAIANLSVMELSELIKAIEEKFGVKAQSIAPIQVQSPTQTSSEGKSEEKTEFTVILKAVPDVTRKISVIKVVREAVGQNIYVHIFGVSSPRLALKLSRYVDSVDISTPIRAAVAREVIVEVDGKLKRVHISAIGEEQLLKILETVSNDLAEKFRSAKRLRDAIRAIAVYNAYVLINWLKKSA